jgi:hypothetical protein
MMMAFYYHQIEDDKKEMSFSSRERDEKYIQNFSCVNLKRSLLYNAYRVSFPGGKATGAWHDHPPPCSADVKKRAKLSFYPPLGFHSLFHGELYIFHL